MFTGIITSVGTVRAVEQRGDLRLTIGTQVDLTGLQLGGSVACSGVCLTAVDKGSDWFAVDVSGETTARTAPSLWSSGARLNLERAMRLGDELGGHIVTGHVDAVGEVSALIDRGASIQVEVDVPSALGPMIAEKGSITLDGVSLTVNSVDDAGDRTRFGVNIIPHTAAQTTFDELRVGRLVNVEVDVLARYLQRLAARTTM